MRSCAPRWPGLERGFYALRGNPVSTGKPRPCLRRRLLRGNRKTANSNLRTGKVSMREIRFALMFLVALVAAFPAASQLPQTSADQTALLQVTPKDRVLG